MNCEEAEDLMSPYLDNELLQFKAQLLENHLEECSACKRKVEEFRRIREEMRGMEFPQPTDEELRNARPQVVIRATRGVGWTLAIVFAAVLACFGVYEFIREPTVKAIEKVAVLGLILGIAFLLVSVLHERIVESGDDKYKEIER